MRSVIYSLCGASFTIATAWALGTVLLRRLSVSLDELEERLLGFVAGTACLSTIILALCTLGLARKGSFLVLGLLATLIVLRGRANPKRGDRPARLPRAWRLLFALGFGLLT